MATTTDTSALIDGRRVNACLTFALRDNAFKVPLAERAVVRALTTLGGRP